MSNYETLSLRQIGEAAWGSHWMTDMASALSVGDRTMRHWTSDTGAQDIPADLEDELRDALLERVRVIQDMVLQLETVGIDRTPVQAEGFQTQVYTTMRRPGERRKR